MLGNSLDLKFPLAQNAADSRPAHRVRLDTKTPRRYRTYMAQSILIFDFGTNEEAAQQARLKVDAWQQGSRLGKKILLKFDRQESNGSSEAAATDSPATKAPKGKSKKSSETQPEKENAPSTDTVRVLIRLDFSGHEKLTLQRWLDRIPSEAPFNSARAQTVRHSDAAFPETSALFDSID